MLLRIEQSPEGFVYKIQINGNSLTQPRTNVIKILLEEKLQDIKGTLCWNNSIGTLVYQNVLVKTTFPLPVQGRFLREEFERIATFIKEVKQDIDCAEGELYFEDDL